MATYQVIDLDVWGNEDDGFEVNNAYGTGTYIDIPDINNDADIVLALVVAGILNESVVAKDLEIDGDEYCLYVDEFNTCRPIVQLRLED